MGVERCEVTVEEHDEFVAWCRIHAWKWVWTECYNPLVCYVWFLDDGQKEQMFAKLKWG
jgi:hypothetical protein